MAEFRFSDKKNQTLRSERKIAFEDLIPLLEIGSYKIIPNPNQKQHSGEYAFLVEYNGYPHVIPFIEGDGDIHLKTIVPMRRFKDEKDQDEIQ
jgi:hypothetical protein